MEKQFGWPMGPAYLLDVVGIDTAHHAQAVMATGFPQRMQKDYRDAIDALFDANRFGQKNGLGFWRYKEDSKGKPKKKKIRRWMACWPTSVSRNATSLTMRSSPG